MRHLTLIEIEGTKSEKMPQLNFFLYPRPSSPSHIERKCALKYKNRLRGIDGLHNVKSKPGGTVKVKRENLKSKPEAKQVQTVFAGCLHRERLTLARRCQGRVLVSTKSQELRRPQEQAAFLS